MKLEETNRGCLRVIKLKRLCYMLSKKMLEMIVLFNHIMTREANFTKMITIKIH